MQKELEKLYNELANLYSIETDNLDLLKKKVMEIEKNMTSIENILKLIEN